MVWGGGVMTFRRVPISGKEIGHGSWRYVSRVLGTGSFDGELPDDKFKNKIQILSFSFGVSNSGTGAVGSGSGAGKASVHGPAA